MKLNHWDIDMKLSEHFTLGELHKKREAFGLSL